MALSQIGVLRTLCFPNCCTNPSVTLKAPPYSAMSCPMIINSGYKTMDCLRASLIASIKRFLVKIGLFNSVKSKIVLGKAGANKSATSSCTDGCQSSGSMAIFKSASILCFKSFLIVATSISVITFSFTKYCS